MGAPDACADLLACPGCGGGIVGEGNAARCDTCGRRFPFESGVLDLLAGEALDPAVASVSAFYERHPFPGYERLDTAAALVERARRGRFAAALDFAIPAEASVLDLGCGTGQLSNFLALGRRTVVGADLSVASLAMGAAFAARFGIDGARFVRTDLLRPALAPASFDVAIATGVLHHLARPSEGFARAAALVRPGGHLVVGLYHRFGRLATRARGLAIRRAPRALAFLDPQVRRNGWRGERRTAWIEDQYFHPLESRHRVAEVLAWYRDAGFEWIASAPPIGRDDGGSLFRRRETPGTVGRVLREVSWAARLGREGGLFVTVGRRRDGESARRVIPS